MAVLCLVACEKNSLNESYLDLGLPSGTKWKTANEYGYYEYDKALAKFGDNLPTKEQFEELVNECTWTWENGDYKVVGPNGRSITLPACGSRDIEGVIRNSNHGFYWSSTSAGSGFAWQLHFSSSSVLVQEEDIPHFNSIRLVR